MEAVKINNKYKNTNDSEYRSQLERYCALKLAENNIPFCYECWKVKLLDTFKYPSVEKTGKIFKNLELVRPITYQPDFVGDDWVIETKGQRTPDFKIKWKMFKHFLNMHELGIRIYMPTNQKEVNESILDILDNIKENA